MTVEKIPQWNVHYINGIATFSFNIKSMRFVSIQRMIHPWFKRYHWTPSTLNLTVDEWIYDIFYYSLSLRLSLSRLGLAGLGWAGLRCAVFEFLALFSEKPEAWRGVATTLAHPLTFSLIASSEFWRSQRPESSSILLVIHILNQVTTDKTLHSSKPSAWIASIASRNKFSQNFPCTGWKVALFFTPIALHVVGRSLIVFPSRPHQGYSSL